MLAGVAGEGVVVAVEEAAGAEGAAEAGERGAPFK